MRLEYLFKPLFKKINKIVIIKKTLHHTIILFLKKDKIDNINTKKNIINIINKQMLI